MTTTWSLAVHGGAHKTGKSEAHPQAVLNGMRDALEAGRAILSGGGSALEAVRSCVKILEDNPHFNAGYGAIANADGLFELDAAIMNGRTLAAGAVAAVRNIHNPVDLAALVMEKTRHILLCGQGAMDFARAHNVATADDDYFRTALKQIKTKHEGDHGTVGAVARDIHGNLAAATSTGGWDAKMPGRIGDAPVIGAGTWADNNNCAVSCTGQGEDFIRTSLARYVSFLVEDKGLPAAAAAERAIAYLAARTGAPGGFVMIDRDGNTAAARTSATLRHGMIERGGETKVLIT